MMNSIYQYNKSSRANRNILEKLSSGYGINRAADNVAGLSISEKLRALTTGLSQAEENIQDGISLCFVADSGIEEITNMLQRIRELAAQSSNGVYDYRDRIIMQEEVSQLYSQIDTIAESTNFNGIYMLTKGKVTNNNTSSSGSVVTGGIGSTVDDSVADMLAGQGTFGGTQADRIGNAYFEEDGYVTFVGTTNSDDIDLDGTPSKSGDDAWIYRLDKDGNKVFSTSLQKSGNQSLGCITKTQDGGYFATGSNQNRGYFVKFDKDGKLEWEYTSSGSGIWDGEGVNGMIQRDDGKILIGFQTTARSTLGISVAGGGRNVLSIVFDPTVDPNANFSGAFTKVTQLSTGGGNQMVSTISPVTFADGSKGFATGNYTTGSMPSIGNGHRAWMIVVDSNGDIKHQLGYGDIAGNPASYNDGEGISQLIQTEDGGYLAVGNSSLKDTVGNGVPENGNPNGKDAWVIKLDSNFNVLWSRTYGSTGTDGGSSITEVADGYIVTANVDKVDGDITDSAKGGRDLWMFKIDKISGNIIWDKIFGGSGDEQWGSIYKTTDNNILISATSNSNDQDLDGINKGNNDVWFFKVNGITGEISKGGGGGSSSGGAGSASKPGSNGYTGDIIIHCGADYDDSFIIKHSDMRAKTLFENMIIDVSTINNTRSTMTYIDKALENASIERGKFGIYANALERIGKNVSNYAENITAAESRIRDLDKAKGVLEHVKLNILLQSSQAMIAQANTSSRSVLSLLQ